MKEIYSIAQRTVVYLGGSDSDSDKSLMALQTSINSKGTSRPISDEVKTSLAAQILSRPWFTRVWVYQELVLSREVWVQCGRIRVSWDTLCAVLLDRSRRIQRDMSPGNITLREWNHGAGLLTSMYETRGKFRMSIIDGENPPSLKDILSTRRGFGVSDLRDMVYGHIAVAGLHRPEKKTTLAVDYTKSISEVFVDAASYIYISSDNIKLLLEVDGETSSRRQDLPSWVPDWSLDVSKILPGLSLESPGDSERFPYDLGKKVFCIRDLRVLAFESSRLTEVQAISPVVFPSLTDAWDLESNACKLAIDDFNEASHDSSSGLWTTIPEESQRLHIGRVMYQFWQQKLGETLMPPLEEDLENLTKNLDFSMTWYSQTPI